MATAQCEQLRSLAQDCLEKHIYSSAAFFADKLVTLSGGRQPGDVYLLAQTLFVSQQYRRTLHLLQRSGLVEADGRFRYLAAKCQAQCGEWEECLTTLGDGEGEEGASAAELQAAGLADPAQAGRSVSTYAAICLLRGQAYHTLENRVRAVKWLKAAVVADPFCHEAFATLVDGHMLTSAEESALVASIVFPPGARWLELMYRVRCKKYDQEGEVEGRLAELEAPHGEARGVGGCGLAGNADVLSCRADWHFHRGCFKACYDLTSQLLERDPYQLSCLPTHLAAGLQLGKKNELFIRGHRLVEEYPERAVAWFAVGCYHSAIGQHDAARRYFGKCTSMEPRFVPGWVAFGNAFAAQDESDQAMAAYRTAARLFPGLHQPVLGIGMEYQRMNNFTLAQQMFQQALQICPQDPLVCNELGVLLFRNGDYVQAEQYLKHGLSLVPGGTLSARWEPAAVNLGHTLRKLGRHQEALGWYDTALGLCPSAPGTYAAIGYTNHLMGNLTEAIDNYHIALGSRPEDTFTAEMLTVALHEECAQYSHELAAAG
eukprot:jgi/Tetstr1/448165/TSEL_035456.t1